MTTYRPFATTLGVKPKTGGLFVPPPITMIGETGLSALWLQDLALKILYFQGYMTGFKVAEEMALPFAGVIDQILENLKREKFTEIKSSQHVGLGEGAYVYAITGAGIARAREALERSQYAGPAPVPIKVYNESVLRQGKGRLTVVSRGLNKLSPISCFPSEFFNVLARQ